MATPTAPVEVALQTKLTALARPELYPESCTSVEAVETHCAWVFLTRSFAYKLKKPMRLDRMDNLLLASRHRNCQEELRLNRRLAPTVYLDVVALRLSAAGTLSLDGTGTPVEWLVKMRRLPGNLFLDRALQAGKLGTAAVRPVFELLADFYRAQPPVPTSGEAYCRRLEQELEESGQALADRDLGLPESLIGALIAQQRRLLHAERPGLARRAQSGRIIEAHGDLKPEHVHLGDPPCIIDCLEFDRSLRLMDPLEELAYFSIECEQMGAAWLGREALGVYLKRSGEHVDDALFGFYRGRRAARRALTVAWHLRDPSVRARKDWAKIAAGYLARAGAP